jgi:hypothetical protein
MALSSQYGGSPWHLLAVKQATKNKQSKIWRDLRWPLFDDYLCNNQPKTIVNDEKGKGEEIWLGRSGGEHDSVVLGAIELGYFKNLNWNQWGY